MAVEKMTLVNTTKLEASATIRGEFTNSKPEITCEGKGVPALKTS